MGYDEGASEFLKSHGISVGDHIMVRAGLTYEGILMPRYEGGGQILVIKLKSGYNVGVSISEITEARRTGDSEENTDTKKQISSPAAALRSSSLPRMLLISTGGTISSKIDYRTGAVSPALTPEELRASVPELSDIADVIPLTLFSEYSENLQPGHWTELAQRLDSAVKEKYAGIIVAHGTDTMQYTASYLSFALAGFAVPVAMVGSQRSSDRPSSDAASNIIAAARFLAGEPGRGIYVVMHLGADDGTVACHTGTRVRKNHTSKRGAFETVGGNPAFVITGNKIMRNSKSDPFGSAEYTPHIVLDERAALAKYHPGYDPRTLDYMIDSGVRAVIFEGTGLGHIGKTMYDSVKKAAKGGVFMGMTSQCIEGRVSMAVYESGRDLLDMGIIPLADMLPETALVKAMWSLGMRPDGNIKDLMLRNISGEANF